MVIKFIRSIVQELRVVSWPNLEEMVGVVFGVLVGIAVLSYLTGIVGWCCYNFLVQWVF